MENMTETMTNEVMEVAEETTTSGSKLGLGALIGAAVIGLGFGGYKLIKKLKAKKADKVIEATDYVEVEDCDEDDE